MFNEQNTDERIRPTFYPKGGATKAKSKSRKSSPLNAFDPIRVASLEHDVGWHRGHHALESWHFASNLTGGGQTYSFRIHVLLLNRAENLAEMSINMCLMNPDTGWIRELEQVVPLSDIEICGEDLTMRTDSLLISIAGSELSISADLPDVIIELDGLMATPVLLNEGIGRFDFLGAKQYKFAVPTIHVTGAVCVMGARQPVSGAMWFNRQWGALPSRFSLQRDMQQRQWISIYPHLSNGINVSVTQMWDFRADQTEIHCTVMLPDGTHRVEKVNPLLLSSHVPSRLVDNKRYPRHVILQNEASDTYLQINLPYTKHEIVSRIGELVVFDGEISVGGQIYGEEITGDGFVEMAGRWS